LFGVWAAISSSASSRTSRLRGRLRRCASVSRHAASAFRTLRNFGLPLRGFRRIQAVSGSSL